MSEDDANNIRCCAHGMMYELYEARQLEQIKILRSYANELVKILERKEENE